MNNNLVVKKNSNAYTAISKLKSGSSVIFYEQNPFRALIVTPIKSIDENLALQYTISSGYIIFSKEKINSLYGAKNSNNGIVFLSEDNFLTIFNEIKHSFTCKRSNHIDDMFNFKSTNNLHNLAIMLTKEAEEIPVLFSCDLHFNDYSSMLYFAFENDISVVSSNDCIEYKNDFKLSHLSTSELVLRDIGNVSLYLYKDYIKHHCAIVKDNLGIGLWKNPMVRIHSSCYTGDVLGSMLCDCHDQLHKSMQLIAKDQEGGLLIYLNQEGRSIGLDNKLKAYHLQNKCDIDTVEANHVLGFCDDERNFDVALKILKCFNIKRMRLVTNNPSKVQYFKNSGIVLENIPIIATINLHNKNYLETKVKKMGHKISSCV